MSLEYFHPAVARWFAAQFPEPTAAQVAAWPAIALARDTLIAAPTGSGKTLAAFLSAIDQLVRQAATGELPEGTQVVYVSPLKALSNDIQRNLEQPLAGIAAELEAMGLNAAPIRTRVRTGDTPQAERVAMRKSAPHILVTTPESLYLLLPDSPLEAVMSNEVWENLYDRLAELIQTHHTTLIFANTRRMVERVTRHLSERIGEDCIAAHHGSLAKQQRFDAERRLKGGTLRALVATASLELGIDIGDVELVCQLGTPRSISTFLQRVG